MDFTIPADLTEEIGRFHAFIDSELSKDLKNRGWKFSGPTTAYAFMQAIGMVNDHIKGCAIRAVIEVLRSKFKRPQQKGRRVFT